MLGLRYYKFCYGSAQRIRHQRKWLGIDCALNKAEEGRDYSFTLDCLDIISENETVFSATGEINVSKLNEEITKPSGTEYRIFEMPVDELSPVMESISDSIDSLEESLADYGFGE